MITLPVMISIITIIFIILILIIKMIMIITMLLIMIVMMTTGMNKIRDVQQNKYSITPVINNYSLKWR